MNNNDKIKKILSSAPVPQELEPENIKKMLDEKAPVRKRSNITATKRIVAAATACAVIGGGSYAYISHNPLNRKTDNTVIDKADGNEQETQPNTEELSILSYMSGADDYSQIYSIFKKSADNYDKEITRKQQFAIADDVVFEEAAVETAEEEYVDVHSSMTNGSFSDLNETDGIQNDEIIETPTAAPSVSTDIPKGVTGDTPREEVPEEEIPVEEETIAEPTQAVSTDDEFIDETEEESHDFSDTYNQEEGVLEADIVKTDGEFIYYIKSDYYDSGYKAFLRTAEVENGEFFGAWSLDLAEFTETFVDSNADYSSVSINDMYLYNDMLAVIGTVYESYNSGEGKYDYYEDSTKTVVIFCTTGAEPEIFDYYIQDGDYNDVRIAPDGFMYLITDYSSSAFYNVKDENEYEKYIPECGFSDQCGLISPQNILLPTSQPQSNPYLSYSILGSIDLNTSGQPSACDVKALADYSGVMYTSANNIYTACQKYSDTFVQETGALMTTDITRIAIGNGMITPVASGTVDGYVKDQFSMSEYDGYFRIAVTCDKYTKHEPNDNDGKWWKNVFSSNDESYYMSFEGRDNRVYVLDYDMNIVGSVEDFGLGESVKSVSFSGNMAYVVTYQQTDPLFAIDLSNPTNPVILDEFKINGYSTYMQKWTDGLLLGFGVDADDRGVETGVKLVMFDNSNPENLKEVGFYAINHTDSKWYHSIATYDRKALLISPDRNLIGFPLNIVDYDNYYGEQYEYIFFKYENGAFIPVGEFYSDSGNYSGMIDRALYIDDYVYILSGRKFIAADMETMTVSAELDFNNIQLSERETVTTTAVTTTETETTVSTTETTAAEPVTTETATEEVISD